MGHSTAALRQTTRPGTVDVLTAQPASQQWDEADHSGFVAVSRKFIGIQLFEAWCDGRFYNCAFGINHIFGVLTIY